MAVCVMSCSHAMIILCGVCTLSGQCLPRPLWNNQYTVCDVQGRSSHNGNYVFSRTDWRLFFFFFFMVRTIRQSDRGGVRRKKRQRGGWPGVHLQGGVDLCGLEGKESFLSYVMD